MPDVTPERQFAALVAADASRPFVTYYDEASGERTELSRKSLANWVAKTHHLLGDELGLGHRDTAVVALPAHWLAVPVLLGCLSAGLEFVAPGAPADVAFVVPDTTDAGQDAGELFALAPASAAVGFRGAEPEGVQDYVLAVRPQADAWASVRMPAGPHDPCLPGLTRGATVERAAARAAEIGLAAGGRLLSARTWNDPQDWIDALLVPLAVGGSLVIVVGGDDAVLERRADQERATARL